MIQILKVTGESLSPFFQDGDFVLIVKIPAFLRSVRQGDIVVFRHPVYGIMIKQVERVSPDGEQIEVIGSHPDSTDSRQFGPVTRRSLIGKVVWHVPKVGLHKEPGS